MKRTFAAGIKVLLTLVGASALGYIANACLNVLNPDEVNDGEWTVELQ